MTIENLGKGGTGYKLEALGNIEPAQGIPSEGNQATLADLRGGCQVCLRLL